MWHMRAGLKQPRIEPKIVMDHAIAYDDDGDAKPMPSFFFSCADVFRQNPYTHEDNRTNLVHNHRWVDSHSVHLRDTQKKRMGCMPPLEDITTPPKNLP